MYIRDRFKAVKFVPVLLHFHPKNHAQMKKVKDKHGLTWDDLMFMAVMRL